MQSIVSRSIRLSQAYPIEKLIEWTFRIAVAAEFIGHGAFGIFRKKVWLNYITPFGISESVGMHLMPIIGTIDITLGIVALIAPNRFVLGYMSIWGLFTACLRPIAGESVFEVVERTYNFMIPFFFLWFILMKERGLNDKNIKTFQSGLRWCIGLSFIGHGGLAAITEKALLGNLWSQIPILGNVIESGRLLLWGGMFEIFFGLLLIFSNPSLIVFSFATALKFASELLHIPANIDHAFFEVLERGSAYACPILVILFKIREFEKLPMETTDTAKKILAAT